MPFIGTGHLWIIGIILIIVLIIWGPGKLPDVGAGLGRAIREFRKASSETREEFSKATRYEQPPANAPMAGTAQAIPAQTAAPEAPVAPAQPAPVGGGSATAPASERAAGEGDHSSSV